MRNFKQSLAIIFRGFGFVHNLSPKQIPLTILDAFFIAIAPLITLFMSARILDAMIQKEPLELIATLVGITMGLNLMVHLLSHLLTMWRSRSFERMLWNNDMKMNQKIMAMDYATIENPKTHALYKKIKEYENMNFGALSKLMSSFEQWLKSLFAIILSLWMMPKLFTEATWMTLVFVIFIAIGMGLNLHFQTVEHKRFYNYYGQVMDINRVFGFYQDHVSDYNVGKGVRLYHQKPLLYECIRSFIEDSMGSIFNQLGMVSAKSASISTTFSTFSSAMVYVYVGLQAVTGTITAGSVIKYIGGITQIMKGCEGLMQASVEMINNNQYLQDYIDFLEIDTSMYHGSLPVEKRDDDAYEIAFHNVSFKYPGTENYALKNVSLKMKIGERLAIVGMNGSGKTTLIKLLCRLYDPTEGVITLNGIDIKKYDYQEYLSLFSVVFQDFALFSFTLGQNIATETAYDSKKVEKVLSRVGLAERYQKMTKGLETYLYKYFDVTGEEISGGEAQKIALARAVYRDAPIVILDEPTASLDPISEFEIYSKFNEIIKTKTAFYISHRLSSCRFCDAIAVFHEGELIQLGQHEKLLEDPQGKYHELWYAQANYYCENTVAS